MRFGMLTVLTKIRSTKVLWLVEVNLPWKTMLGGRQPLVEDDLQWKTILGGRLPVVEDNLQWKMTFSGRRPLMEDDLRWKSTFGGRKHLVEDNLRWILACCLVRFAAFCTHRSSYRGCAQLT